MIMNPKYLEILNKIDIRKTAVYAGGALFIIIMILYVRKKIREAKAERESEKIIEQYEKASDPASRTYSDVEYKMMADSIYAHIHASVMSANGGLTGVNQQGIYDVMSRMKTDDDLNMLISAYGLREYRKPGRIYFKRPCNYLPGTLVDVMTRGELKKINDILSENGLTLQIS